MRTFDPTKPVQTRNGRNARIICTDAVMSSGQIIALIKTAEGLKDEYIRMYSSGGRFFRDREHPLDLVNVPVQKVRYLNLYGFKGGVFIQSGGILHETQESAKAKAQESAQDAYLLKVVLEDDVVVSMGLVKE